MCGEAGVCLCGSQCVSVVLTSVCFSACFPMSLGMGGWACLCVMPLCLPLCKCECGSQESAPMVMTHPSTFCSPHPCPNLELRPLAMQGSQRRLQNVGTGRQIVQGHSTDSGCRQGAARDVEGTDPCVGGGQLRLHRLSSSELWAAVSKESVYTGGALVHVSGRSLAAIPLSPLRTPRILVLVPTPLARNLQLSISLHLFLCTPEMAAS